MVVYRREMTIGQPPDERDLAFIVDRARRGSADAFEELTRRVRDRVRAWAVRITRDPDDAEDVAQLVLLRARDRLDGFEGQSRFTTWLYRVTRNVALNRRRGEVRRAQLLEARRAELTPRESIERAARAIEEENGVARLAAECLSALPARQREIFELADLAGLSSPEIAARLGIDAVTVRVHLGEHRDFSQSFSVEDERLLLAGRVFGISTRADSGRVSLDVTLLRPSIAAQSGQGGTDIGERILSTELQIPVGETVVLGSGVAGPSMDALILVVTPEVVHLQRTGR